MKANYIKFFILVFLPASLIWGASGWVQGGFLVHEISTGVELSELGKSELAVDSAEFPVGIRGRFTARVDPGAKVLLSASNRMFIQLLGPGEFGVERFEHTQPESDMWAASGGESGQSRVLLSLRSGHFFMDTRELSEASQVAVETPLGRIIAHRGLWQMRIAFDQRSDMFTFEIACSEGRLSFTDKRGITYPLGTGQRLSGAGGWMNPGVDVVEMTTIDREAIEAFSSICRTVATDAGRLESYLPHIEVLSVAEVEKRVVPADQVKRRAKRRVIIEYAPQSAQLTPFRGEISAPRSRQVESF